MGGLSRRSVVPCEKANRQTGSPRRLSPGPSLNEPKCYNTNFDLALSFDQSTSRCKGREVECVETCDQDNRCWLASACVQGGRKGWEVGRHTGESATVDVKLSTLCTILVTVIVGDAASKVSTTVRDGCGSRTTFCDTGSPSIVGGSLEAAPWKVQNLLVIFVRPSDG